MVPEDEAILDAVIETVLALPMKEFCDECGGRRPYCRCV